MVASSTADSAFAIAELPAVRDAFPFGRTQIYHSYLAFSCHARSDFGEMKVPRNADVHAELVSKNAKDYLVVMESGRRFTASELRSARPTASDDLIGFRHVNRALGQTTLRFVSPGL